MTKTKASTTKIHGIDFDNIEQTVSFNGVACDLNKIEYKVLLAIAHANSRSEDLPHDEVVNRTKAQSDTSGSQVIMNIRRKLADKGLQITIDTVSNPNSVKRYKIRFN